MLLTSVVLLTQGNKSLSFVVTAIRHGGCKDPN